MMGTSSAGTPAAKRIGRYPPEYQSWIIWEVTSPLVVPLLGFVMLVIWWTGAHDPDSGARALISVSGSGDLLIFAAFLLINVGAKFRALGESEGKKEYIAEGDLNGEFLSIVGISFLLLYMGLRIVLETMGGADVESWKFGFGAFSVMTVVAVVVWIDCEVCKMHLKILQNKANNGLVSNYYNF